MGNTDLPAVLFVDDEKNLLDGLRRQLRKRYRVSTALSGKEGLDIMMSRGPFSVVVSDMKMPHMNGAQFLKKAREIAPDTVRLLLTGQADFQETIDAVNEGNIYRFLHKPCSIPLLSRSLDDAIAQYQLIQDQRILLEQTLRGSIKALIDVLSLSNPDAFGRASRTKQWALDVVKHLGINETWHIEVAAMLWPVGCVSFPQELVDKLYQGETLTEEERRQAEKLPEISLSLLAHIPRIEKVREILEHINTRFDGEGGKNNRARQDLPLGARILKIVLDFDRLVSQIGYTQSALESLKARVGWYDPDLLNAFIATRQDAEDQSEIRMLQLHQLRAGMMFAEDVKTESGRLLIARGQEVSPSLRAKVQQWAKAGTIKGEIPMIMPRLEEEAVADTAS